MIQLSMTRWRPSENSVASPHLPAEWQGIASAPGDSDLELAVIDAEGPHALVFPCRRDFRGWVKAAGGDRVNVFPTHWRHWNGPSVVVM